VATDQFIYEEAKRVLDLAEKENVILRLIGAIAFRMHSESAMKQAIGERPLSDIDFVGYSKQYKEIKDLFRKLNYRENEPFNILHSDRMMFFEPRTNIIVDIFLDKLIMCHTLDFRGRLHLDNLTIPLADLIMSKLQIVQLNEKDVKDIICILKDHELGTRDSDPEKVNIRYIANICRNNWGMYKTFTDNIKKVISLVDNYVQKKSDRDKVKLKLNELLREIESAPKTIRWKLRAIIGEKVRWYEIPTFREPT